MTAAAPVSATPRSPCKLASVLLQYPTVALVDGIGALEDAAARTSPRASREALARFLRWLAATPPTEVAQHYVETFDLRRRCAHLPGLGRRELDPVRLAWEAGPAEEAGLEPFAPPEYLAGYPVTEGTAGYRAPDDPATRAAGSAGREARP